MNINKDTVDRMLGVLERQTQQLAELNTPTMDIDDPVDRKLTIVRDRYVLSLKIATVTPGESEGLLWEMQNLLMLEAQQQLGPRDASKKIYQPTFDADDAQPCVRFDKSGDGAWAELMAEAALRWDQCIYQLSHETVHLLDQTRGKASVLEEGTAVVFARHACSMFGFDMRSTIASYARACTLVEQLPGGVTAAKRLRQAAGSFARVTAEHLVQIGVPQSDAARYLAPLSSLLVPELCMDQQ